MRVKKRNGTYEQIDFAKISRRIKYMVDGLDPNGSRIGEKLDIDPIEIAKSVCGLVIDGITTAQLDEFAAELCNYRVGEHHHYGVLGARIIISNHHKNTEKYAKFSDMTEVLYRNSLVSKAYYDLVMAHRDQLDALVAANHVNDYRLLDYFGFKTLEKSYLIRVKSDGNGEIGLAQERYQHHLMRVALGIYLINYDDLGIINSNLTQSLKTYQLFSQGLLTHATPTLFNSGTPFPQLSSCFLMDVGDSIESMYQTMRRGAHISKLAGGQGWNISNIRGAGSHIRSTNGESSGVIPFCKVTNEEARHVNQGGKRKGSIAKYMEPWHPDILAFLDLRKNQGAEELRARDLFLGLWIPDLFMRRVKMALTRKRLLGDKTDTIKWSLMCPDRCPGLTKVYGQEFDALYQKYEDEGRFVRQLDILQVWQAILDSQKETGLPYMCYKDHVNHKSNQSNIGTICCSNLCTEIMEYCDPNEYAVCNLASINLKMFARPAAGDRKTSVYDHQALYEVACQAVRNLDSVIDVNYYPIPETRRSNMRHRPIGLGVQGLADAFILMGYPFESKEAQQLNREIFETIYYAAIHTSNQLAQERHQLLIKAGRDVVTELKLTSSYLEYYENILKEANLREAKFMSLAEKSELDSARGRYISYRDRAKELIKQHGLPVNIYEYQYLDSEYYGSYSTFVGSPAHAGRLQYDMWDQRPSGRWDFEALKKSIRQYGLRNSLTTTVMPTATTAQILGSNECIEPITSNIYSRQVLSGTFIVVNRYLQQALTELGLWNTEMKDRILMNGGSIQTITEIPERLRQLFKTTWEMSKKTLIDMSADRGAWIDQSQSFNQFVAAPDDSNLTSIHLYGWERGLKTGMYYLRRKRVINPQQFSIDLSKYQDTLKRSSKPQESEVMMCSRDNPDCKSCGT